MSKKDFHFHLRIHGVLFLDDLTVGRAVDASLLVFPVITEHAMVATAGLSRILGNCSRLRMNGWVPSVLVKRCGIELGAFC